MPILTVVGGANGAGKSYFSDFFVTSGLVSVTPINIDALEENVDRDRLPHDPMRYEKSLKAEIDRVFLKLCDEAISNQKDFVFESNLRTDQLSCIGKFEAAGYSLRLIYIWLDEIGISQQRVKIRVNEGGHPVGNDSKKYNFEEGLQNLDFSVSDNHWNSFSS